jgi:hypothetical protein
MIDVEYYIRCSRTQGVDIVCADSTREAAEQWARKLNIDTPVTVSVTRQDGGRETFIVTRKVSVTYTATFVGGLI